MIVLLTRARQIYEGAAAVRSSPHSTAAVKIIAAAECRVNEASVPVTKWMADGSKARRMHVHRPAYGTCLWKRRSALVCVAEGSEQHGRRLRKPHCHGHQVGTGSTPRDYCGDRTVAQRLSAAARCKLECMQAQERCPN